MKAPAIRPLDGPEELAVLRVITHALVEGRWRAGSWSDAEQQATELLGTLRRDHGAELLKVAW